MPARRIERRPESEDVFRAAVVLNGHDERWLGERRLMASTTAEQLVECEAHQPAQVAIGGSVVELLFALRERSEPLVARPSIERRLQPLFRNLASHDLP